MIVGEFRVKGGKPVALVHPGVTHVQGLDAEARRAWATALTQSLQGQSAAGAPIEVVVEIDGKRQSLTAGSARSSVVGDTALSVVVFAGDLPGAKPTAEPRLAMASTTPASDDLAALEAGVASAEAKMAQLRSARAAAERSATEALDAFMAASHRVDKEAAAVLAEAEARLVAATATLTEARSALADFESAASSQADAARTTREGVSALQAERSRLEADRVGLVARMVEGGDPGDPAPVESALAALRRLRQVKAKPSPQAAAIADRWAAAIARLAALPQPPQPPEWLVIPALAALQEAKEAVAAAQTNVEPSSVDPAKIEALDRAHREVLEAEQRSMRKGSRIHRRRLDGAHAAEQAALSALGVRSYGEYLQRMAPGADPGGGPDRVAAAQAGLADAEAVWEELHGGQASPEWTAAKEDQAAARQDAHAFLGREVDDAQLEAALRSHLEAVVESGWAEQELASSLQEAGAGVDAIDAVDADDLEQVAERWLAEAPMAREQRAVLAEQLGDLDSRLAAVEAELAESQSDAFFGQGDSAKSAKVDDGPGGAAQRLAEAIATAERQAEEAATAVANARERVAASTHEEGRLAGLESDADARRREVDELAAQLRDAESAVGKARSTNEPAVGASETVDPGIDLSGVVGMEAEAYLLARVAALRGAPGGPLPLVIDVDAVAGLTEAAGRRVFRLLGRLAGSMQVVVLGDDEKVATWAEGLGDQAAVRAVAR